MDHYGHFGWFSFLILPQIKWLDTLLKCHNGCFLFFQMKIQIIMTSYVKKKIDFVQGQNSYRASKLTVKKYFSGIRAGISSSQSVNSNTINLSPENLQKIESFLFLYFYASKFHKTLIPTVAHTPLSSSASLFLYLLQGSKVI